jgi:osmoprotectant transport system permease protein
VPEARHEFAVPEARHELSCRRRAMSYFQIAWQWLTATQQWHGGDGIPVRLVQHLEYTGIALGIALIIALPAGLAMGHLRRGGFVVVTVANFGRALPTLGLLVLIFVLTSGSSASWLVPLVALAIPPILVNTYEGVLGVDPNLTDAARGMGMTEWQVLRKVEIPVATPLILLGLRISAIQVVATATIAAYIGLGGLGRYIIDGLARDEYNVVAGGAAVIVLLALAIQALFTLLRWLIVPVGLRRQTQTS